MSRMVACVGTCGKSYPTDQPEPVQDNPDSVFMFWCFPCRMDFEMWCVRNGVDSQIQEPVVKQEKPQ